jgi:hypothetical protein
VSRSLVPAVEVVFFAYATNGHRQVPPQEATERLPNLGYLKVSSRRRSFGFHAQLRQFSHYAPYIRSDRSIGLVVAACAFSCEDSVPGPRESLVELTVWR